MNVLTPIITMAATPQADSPLFAVALTFTLAGLGAIVASFVLAVQQHDSRK